MHRQGRRGRGEPGRSSPRRDQDAAEVEDTRTGAWAKETVPTWYVTDKECIARREAAGSGALARTAAGIVVGVFQSPGTRVGAGRSAGTSAPYGSRTLGVSVPRPLRDEGVFVAPQGISWLTPPAATSWHTLREYTSDEAPREAWPPNGLGPWSVCSFPRSTRRACLRRLHLCRRRSQRGRVIGGGSKRTPTAKKDRWKESSLRAPHLLDG